MLELGRGACSLQNALKLFDDSSLRTSFSSSNLAPSIMLGRLHRYRRNDGGKHPVSDVAASYRFVHDPPHWPPPVEPSQDGSLDGTTQIQEQSREARVVSESIDRSIAEERSKRKKKPAVKILLLGLSYVLRHDRSWPSFAPSHTVFRSGRVRKIDDSQEFSVTFHTTRISR